MMSDERKALQEELEALLAQRQTEAAFRKSADNTVQMYRGLIMFFDDAGLPGTEERDRYNRMRRQLSDAERRRDTYAETVARLDEALIELRVTLDEDTPA